MKSLFQDKITEKVGIINRIWNNSVSFVDNKCIRLKKRVCGKGRLAKKQANSKRNDMSIIQINLFIEW